MYTITINKNASRDEKIKDIKKIVLISKLAELDEIEISALQEMVQDMLIGSSHDKALARANMILIDHGRDPIVLPQGTNRGQMSPKAT